MICSPSAAAESGESKGTIDFPAGRTVGAEKCFDLEGYKSLAIIYSRHLSCGERGPLTLELVETLDAKHAVLSVYAKDLELALSSIEAEREDYVTSATTSAEIAAREEQRKRVWRAFAIGGIVVSVVLGAVVAGMGAAR